MQKIKKMSHIMIYGLNILLITIPLLYAILWININTESAKNFLKITETLSYKQHTVFNVFQMFIGYISSIVSTTPTLFGMIFLKKLFNAYKKGEIFTVQNSLFIKYISFCFFLYAFVAAPIGEILSTLTVTLSNPPGERIISISAGTPTFESVFCGFVILIISYVMNEAAKLQEEQQFTV